SGGGRGGNGGGNQGGGPPDPDDGSGSDSDNDERGRRPGKGKASRRSRSHSEDPMEAMKRFFESLAERVANLPQERASSVLKTTTDGRIITMNQDMGNRPPFFHGERKKDSKEYEDARLWLRRVNRFFD